MSVATPPAPVAPSPAARPPRARDPLARISRDPRVVRVGERLGRVLGRPWGRALVWIGCFVPAAWLAYQVYLLYLGLPSELGFKEPFKAVEHETGEHAIRFFLISLAITPLRQLTGWGWLQKYRRVFGLLMFAYATFHLLAYAVLDLELQLGEVATEIAKRPYLLVGFASWLLLVPLAVTSTQGWIRRMGGARWNRLHRVAYAVVPLALLHYGMSQKKDVTEPILFGLGFAALLGWRFWRTRADAARRSAVAA